MHVGSCVKAHDQLALLFAQLMIINPPLQAANDVTHE